MELELCNSELHALYASNAIIKSRRLRWAERIRRALYEKVVPEVGREADGYAPRRTCA